MTHPVKVSGIDPEGIVYEAQLEVNSKRTSKMKKEIEKALKIDFSNWKDVKIINTDNV